jgi:hypothetical protein
MSTPGVIAGTLGLVVVAAGLAGVGLAGGFVLYAYQPGRAVAPAQLRAVIEANGDALALCARSLTKSGEITTTVVVQAGEPNYIKIEEPGLPGPVNGCVARTLQGLPWPAGSGALRVTLKLEPPR